MFHFISLIMYNNIVQFRMNVKYVVDEIMDIYALYFNITLDQLYRYICLQCPSEIISYSET